jgi:hypothetical protein
MRLDNYSLAFNCHGCPSWGTAIVNQDSKKVHLIKKDVASNIVIGMMHKCVTLNTHDFSLPIGKGSKIYYGDFGFKDATSEPMMVSVFDKVFVNETKVNAPFILAIIRDKAADHLGRLQIKYTPKLKYGNISNEHFFIEATKALGLLPSTPWVVYELDIEGQEILRLKALIGSDIADLDSQLRNLPQIKDAPGIFNGNGNSSFVEPASESVNLDSEEYLYMSAIKTKPFLILGGFSGTGKSQKVKEMAFATCPCDGVLNNSETSPGNYLLVSVKPNWHDATDITGFRSSVNRNYYVTDFMRFLVKAKLYEDKHIPFFVCLDEMNLAPVEEYFADFLSVIESRKRCADGRIVTDAIVPASVFNDTDYADDFNIFMKLGLEVVNPELNADDINALPPEDKLQAFVRQDIVEELIRDGLTIPSNVVIVGTVNMDDTTNSFSRKVIDRAMTFETIVRKFDKDYFEQDVALCYIKNPRKGELFLSDEVRATQTIEEGRFVLTDDEQLKIVEFINSINEDLEGSPFKISYRILNETILLYRSKKKIKEIMEAEGGFEDGIVFNTDLNSIFDDILMQKVLPRIEGDYEKCNKCLTKLSARAEDNDWNKSLEKIEFMIKRFGTDKSGFTTFWN